MKSEDMFLWVGIVAAGVLIFWWFLMALGAYDIATGGDSDCARILKWSVQMVRGGLQ